MIAHHSVNGSTATMCGSTSLVVVSVKHEDFIKYAAASPDTCKACRMVCAATSNDESQAIFEELMAERGRTDDYDRAVDREVVR